MRLLWVFLIFIIGSYLITARYHPAPVQEVKTLPTLEPINGDKLFSLVNSWRATQGLPEYTKDNRLCDFANERLSDIRKDFSHKDFYNRLGEIPYRQIAENLVQGEITDQQALSNWIESPTHRKNLDYDYHFSCIKSDGYNAVQIFANF